MVACVAAAGCTSDDELPGARLTRDDVQTTVSHASDGERVFVSQEVATESGPRLGTLMELASFDSAFRTVVTAQQLPQDLTLATASGVLFWTDSSRTLWRLEPDSGSPTPSSDGFSGAGSILGPTGDGVLVTTPDGSRLLVIGPDLGTTAGIVGNEIPEFAGFDSACGIADGLLVASRPATLTLAGVAADGTFGQERYLDHDFVEPSVLCTNNGALVFEANSATRPMAHEYDRRGERRRRVELPERSAFGAPLTYDALRDQVVTLSEGATVVAVDWDGDVEELATVPLVYGDGDPVLATGIAATDQGVLVFARTVVSSRSLVFSVRRPL